jgi:hypothetical protein
VEWWIQSKYLEQDGTPAPIDLHYDKDENMAEAYGIGLFPQLSTVTYLTGSPNAPTVIFRNTITEPIGSNICINVFWLVFFCF